jgi:zinc transport system substrate-binding protein
MRAFGGRSSDVCAWPQPLRRRAVLLLLVPLAAAAACHPAPGPQRQVAATVFPLYDIAQRVAGDRLAVQLILQPGLDPHDYEPRPRDVAGLSDAALIFAVGLGLDPWAQRVARAAGAGEARVFEIGPLMDPILAPSGVVRTEPLIDAHFWTDPVRALHAVDVTVEALSGLDPGGGPFYRERGQNLRQSIEALHREISRDAATWRRHRIITFHGSLFYFAARYGLQVVGVVEPVPGSEPPPQHLTDLMQLLRGPDPPALFVEPQLDGQLARSLARETGALVHEVDPMGGAPRARSYEDLLRAIARAMDEALR